MAKRFVSREVPPLRAAPLRARIAAIAALAKDAAAGTACMIAWNAKGRCGVEQAPPDALPDRAAALLALTDRQFEQLPGATAATRVGPGQLALLRMGGATGEIAVEGTAVRALQDGLRVLTILLTPLGRPNGELVALAELANQCAFAVFAGDDARTSRDFWMAEGARAKEHQASAEAALAAAVSETIAAERAVERSAKLRPALGLRRIGALFARTGRCDGWLLALPAEPSLRIAAASRCWPLPDLLDPEGPAAECVARQALVRGSTRPAAASAAAKSADRVNYVCLPWARGAIALAARHVIEPATVGRLERLARRTSPLFELWTAEAEVERLRGLVHTLGLRMFSAVDRERQRIARDLHDHQTQLLTAARLSLEADPAQTRVILKQLDQSLRDRLREIRPAVLGRATLSEALDAEMGRLEQAGVRGRIIEPTRPFRLARPIQELCYQVAHEAFANVLRHARASRIEAELKRSRRRIILRVEDDGRGLRPGPVAADGESPGVGIAGMRERLELLGGRLRIERVGEHTRLTAEIPER